MVEFFFISLCTSYCYGEIEAATLLLYSASKNKKSIQVGVQQGKDVFNIFVIWKAALSCFQSCLQVSKSLRT